MVNFRLDWPPTVNTYYRNVQYRTLISKKGRQYKKDSGLMLMEQSVERLGEARVEVLIEAYPPDRRRRDLDNLLKPVFDVMEEYGVIDDDEQIDILTIRRRGKGGYIEVHVSPIAPEDSLCW